jgi:hypothetical protein
MISPRTLLAALFGSMARDEVQTDRAVVQAQPARVVEDAPVLVDPLAQDLEDFA